MPLHVLLDAHPPFGYGGKVVDLYTEFADMVVRFGRGLEPSQVYHELGQYTEQGHQRLLMMTLPSAILHEGKTCALSSAVRLDPEQCIRELDALSSRGVEVSSKRLLLDAHQPIVMPYHHAMNAHGLSATSVEDVFLMDLSSPSVLSQKLERIVPQVNALLALQQGPRVSCAHQLTQALEWGTRLTRFEAHVHTHVHHMLRKGRHVLLEGPSWGASPTRAAHASLELGLPPSMCTRVIGMTRAYTVMQESEAVQDLESSDSSEMSPRATQADGVATEAIGWLSIPALRRSIQANGLTGMALTHLDVLSGMGHVRLIVEEEGPDAPAVYETFAGWDDSLDVCRHVRELPTQAQRFITRLESLLEVPLVMLSVGPNRAETIVLKRLHR